MARQTKLTGQFEYGEVSPGLWLITDPFGQSHKIEGTEKDAKDFCTNFTGKELNNADATSQVSEL